MSSKQIQPPTCADCKLLSCNRGLIEKAPENCPLTHNSDLLENSLQKYKDKVVHNIACSAAKVESEGYCTWTRIEEIIAFAHKADYKRIGLAYCIGLRKEAVRFNEIMVRHNFEMISVVCKTGAVPKEALGLSDHDKVRPGRFEAICNPVAQAELLNKSGTDLNIILGLCVGHDSLFIRYANAPVTVLAVKDRVLAHNPLGAIYAGHYFDRRFK
ncbi:MAG: DUF1847 domain-containing protein [Bacillota bacterium]